MFAFQNKCSIIYMSSVSEAVGFAASLKTMCFHSKTNQNAFPNVDVSNKIKMPNVYQIFLLIEE